MRVLVASGIFPPDIGGPATHAQALAAELRARGHKALVLSLTDGPRPVRTDDVALLPRQWNWRRRYAAVGEWMVRQRDAYDVVYATGMIPECAAGARRAQKPIVAKVVGDPVWERASRLGLTQKGFEEFQRSPDRHPTIALMRLLNSRALRRADRIVTPSAYLGDVVRKWLGPRDVRVIPNGVVAHASARGDRDPNVPMRIVYVGRLIPHKNVETIIRAASESGVALTIVGDGPDRRRLEQISPDGPSPITQFLGSLPHPQVMDTIAQADFLVLASGYEGLPHVAIEALAAGVPVIGPPVGGLPEAVRDGYNGRIISGSLTETLKDLSSNPGEVARLAEGARESGREWSFTRTADRISDLLSEVLDRPRVTILGQGALLADRRAQEKKLAIIGRHVDAKFVTVARSDGASMPPGSIAIKKVRPAAVGGLLFYVGGPVAALATSVRGRPSAILCQSPYEGALTVAGSRLIPRGRRPRIIIEAHGDWRTATRLYGSPARRLLSPVADALAAATIRRADRVRVVSNPLRELVLSTGYTGPLDQFITYSDYERFGDSPPVLPGSAAQVLFVGVLERYKAVDVLLDAWAKVVTSRPVATLVMAGSGSMRDFIDDRLQALGIEERVRLVGHVDSTEVVRLLDESLFLVLPSRSEGLPRIILESFARARAVITTPVGGIPNVVRDGVNGILVDVDDRQGLAVAIEHLLDDPDRAAAMGAQGRTTFESWDPAGDYEKGFERLSSWLRGLPGDVGR